MSNQYEAYHYFLIAFKAGATGGGNVIRLQKEIEIKAQDLKEINEDIREQMGRFHEATPFHITNISYLGLQYASDFGDVNGWQAASEAGVRRRQI